MKSQRALASFPVPGCCVFVGRCEIRNAHITNSGNAFLGDRPWRSLHRLVQLLGVGLDLTDVLSADPTIREETVFVF